MLVKLSLKERMLAKQTGEGGGGSCEKRRRSEEEQLQAPSGGDGPSAGRRSPRRRSPALPKMNKLSLKERMLAKQRTIADPKHSSPREDGLYQQVVDHTDTSWRGGATATAGGRAYEQGDELLVLGESKKGRRSAGNGQHKQHAAARGRSRDVYRDDLVEEKFYPSARRRSRR